MNKAIKSESAPSKPQVVAGGDYLDRLVRPFSRVRWVDSREAFAIKQRTRRARVIETINSLKCPPYNAHHDINPDLTDACIYRDAEGKKFWLRWGGLYGFRGDKYEAVLLA